jgi:ribose transport system substrate-binding protein
MKRVSRTVVRGLAAAGLITGAVAGAGNAVHAHRTGAASYTIGFANSLIGNGWREEMICSAKVQAMTSKIPARVVVQETQGNTAQMISQIRNMISQGVNAIIIDPPDATSLNAVIAQAVSKGIKVVVVDQLITSKLAYQVENDQVAYGRLGMEWLAKQLHGHGNVALLQGIAGASADTDRHTGIMQALAKYPGIKVVASPYTGWQYATGASDMTTLLNSGKKIDGVWTSGIDYTVVDAFKTAGKPYVPVVGADNNGFVQQIINLHTKGFVGGAVTNPSTVGGAGMALALNLLAGKTEPHIQKLIPQVWDYAHNAAQLKSVAFTNRGPTFTVQWQVPGFTTYSKTQFLNTCKG